MRRATSHTATISNNCSVAACDEAPYNPSLINNFRGRKKMLTRREALFGTVAAGISVITRGNTLLSAAGPQPATAVNFPPPAGTTDTHRHVFGDLTKFPYSPNSGYRHEPATIDDMRKLDRTLHVARRVLIQPSGYGTDNSCLLDTLK